MLIEIKSDSAKLAARLEALVKKQATFAAAVAATKTAKDVRDQYVLPNYRRTFDVKNRAFEKVVHNVSAADARHAKKTGIAVAAIKRKDSPRIQGTAKRAERSSRGPTDTSFMERHVKGGTKTPKGKHLAIPISDGSVRRRKGGPKAGAILKASQPKTIIDRGGFVLGKRGKQFIARRRKRGKGKGLEIMYSLANQAQIPKRYNPMPDAERGVRVRYPVQWRFAFIKALKTAKLR